MKDKVKELSHSSRVKGSLVMICRFGSNTQMISYEIFI